MTSLKKNISLIWNKYVDFRSRAIMVSKENLGSDYGGWTICPTGLGSTSTVYSFGIGEDISFDLAVIDKYFVQLFAFDPTPRSIQWVGAQKVPSNFHWFDYGIANFDGTIEFYPPDNPEFVSHSVVKPRGFSSKPLTVPVRCLTTIMEILGHDTIDILKLDIEGAEYDVLENIVNSKIVIDQILVEFHHNSPEGSILRTIRTVNFLYRAGYRIFNLSQRGYEYSFIYKGQL